MRQPPWKIGELASRRRMPKRIFSSSRSHAGAWEREDEKKGIKVTKLLAPCTQGEKG